MKDIALNHTLFKNNRIHVSSFMGLPKGMWSNSNKTGIYLDIYPMIFIRCQQNSMISEEYDFKKAQYKVDVKNQYSIIKFFNKIVDWFYGDQYDSLFVVDENQRIVVNADFKSLHLNTKRIDLSNQVLKAVPAIVELGGVTYEGIQLYINEFKYCVPLTYQEVNQIFNIIKTFSFYEEASSLLQAYQILKSENRITNREYKTPFD